MLSGSTRQVLSFNDFKRQRAISALQGRRVTRIPDAYV